ncbi:S8 family serine peptidase [Candidatus Bipolaricaulota bacterium]|nr:S8 family serine peptidase [Candidatus Bipolaricaulota bacterium]
MSHRSREAFAILVIVLAATGSIYGQTPSSDWIAGINIPSLTPLQVTFRLTNSGSTTLARVSGQAILSDQFGRSIEVLGIDSFSLNPGASTTVSASSRWSFQQTGVYLIEVALDLGGGHLISNSLAFRILPIQLPLAPPTAAFGEGLMTLYQQPVNWGILRIFAPEAWMITHGRSDVVVAVIDTGIDTSIPQLKDCLWNNPGEIANNGIDDDGNGYIDDIHGWDFRDGDNSSLVGSKLHWHGTFVAGIIAAQPGEVPIVGVAPGVRIMDVRFLDSDNTFSSRDWNMFADAIDYAVDNGANIINMSIYANSRPPTILETAIHRAAQAGVVIIGISGNTSQTGVLYPGKYDDVYAVSATTENDQLAGFSTRGPEVAFCAPGEGITSFLPGGQTATRSGTSFAAPHVSGTLALILSAYPSLTPVQAVNLLVGSLIDLGIKGTDPSFGQGLIDAFEAVNN